MGVKATSKIHKRYKRLNEQREQELEIKYAKSIDLALQLVNKRELAESMVPTLMAKYDEFKNNVQNVQSAAEEKLLPEKRREMLSYGFELTMGALDLIDHFSKGYIVNYVKKNLEYLAAYLSKCGWNQHNATDTIRMFHRQRFKRVVELSELKWEAAKLREELGLNVLEEEELNALEEEPEESDSSGKS